jgi:hypothetical protein
LRAFSEIFAKVSRFVPYFQRYSRPGAAEHLRGGRGLVKPCTSFITPTCLVERVGAVVELRAERALLHLLEADGEHALGQPALDRLPRRA